MTNQDYMRALLPVNWVRQFELRKPSEAAAYPLKSSSFIQ
jgi:hypothetical protein